MIVKINKALVDICKIEGVQCIKRLSSTDTGLTYDVQAVLNDGQVILIDVVEYDALDSTLDNILSIINNNISNCS